MTTLGRVVAITDKTLGDQLASAHTLGVTTLAVTDSRAFAPGPGSLSVDGDVYAYLKFTAANDEDETITLATPTTVAYDADERVELSPVAPYKIAQVMFNNEGEPIPVLVPHDSMAYLSEGLYDPPIEVEVEADSSSGYGWKIVAVSGRAPVFNASTAKIVTATDGGERVEIDGDGIMLYTNDAIKLASFSALSYPACIAKDAAGDYYVGGNNIIRKFTSGGTQVATGGFPIVTAGYNWAIALNGTDLLVADTATDVIRKYTSAGVEVLTGGFPFSTTGRPNGLATDGTNIFVADSDGFLVRKFTMAGVEVTTGGFPITLAGFPKPVMLDGTHIYVADLDVFTIRKFTMAGVEVATGGFPIDTVGQASSAAVDAVGNIYAGVHDTPNGNLIRKFDSAGVQTDTFSTTGTAVGVTLDANGDIVTTDGTYNMVRRFNNPGTFVVSALMDTSTGRLVCYDATVRGSLMTDIVVTKSLNSGGELKATAVAELILTGAPVTIASPGSWPEKIRAGSGVVATTAAATQSVAVTFTPAFATAPKISLDVISTTPNLFQSSHGAATTSGFTIYLYRTSGSGNITVDWTAIVA